MKIWGNYATTPFFSYKVCFLCLPQNISLKQMAKVYSFRTAKYKYSSPGILSIVCDIPYLYVISTCHSLRAYPRVGPTSVVNYICQPIESSQHPGMSFLLFFFTDEEIEVEYIILSLLLGFKFSSIAHFFLSS